MSDENKNERGQSDEDVLKALHGLGNSDESEVEGDQEHEMTEEKESEEGAPSPAASGFVGMLAKAGKDGGLDAGAKQEAGAGDSGLAIKGPLDQIHMAREIRPVEGAGAGAEAGAGGAALRSGPRVMRVQRAPGWYHAAMPVMYTLGSLLMLIGLWSIGALILIAVASPKAGNWWLLSTMRDPETDALVYTQGSKAMAWVMLACLPVSLALGMMAGIMQRHIRAERRAMEKEKGQSGV